MLVCDVTSRLHRRIATSHRRIATSHPRIAHRVTYNQRRNGGPSQPSYISLKDVKLNPENVVKLLSQVNASITLVAHDNE